MLKFHAQTRRPFESTKGSIIPSQKAQTSNGNDSKGIKHAVCAYMDPRLGTGDVPTNQLNSA